VSASSDHPTHYRLDDLRRIATSLASGVGVVPTRASALATHLLWFDAAGASSHGIATLPNWLDKVDRKEIDAVAVGRAGQEHAGTAVFDAQNGLGPLALETAAGIASEKARDVGVGIVRVRNLGYSGPSAPIAANLAIGPIAAMVAGPGPSLSIALPMPEGLPAVYDSTMGKGIDPSTEGLLRPWSPWISALSGGEGWLILALAVSAMEPLTSFHVRVASSFDRAQEGAGLLSPESWEASRRVAREHGVSIPPDAIESLKGWANRLGVPWPTSVGGRG
jgi:LDH2 family malate/lactate/ureidoglycolate dehydrogenase